MKVAKKDQKNEPVESSAELTFNVLEQLYIVLQSCSNQPNVQTATIAYCRRIKKQVLTNMMNFGSDVKDLMTEYKVPQGVNELGQPEWQWSGLKDEKLIAGLYAELLKQTYKLENLNALSQTEFIKHTRGLSESQMDLFEKYLVKAE